MNESPNVRTSVAPAGVEAPGTSAAVSMGQLDARFETSLGRATAVMVGLTLLASATNYASNVVFSRLLSTASYGDLTALLAFTVIAALPTGAAQTVVAERLAVLFGSGKRDSARYLIRHALAHVGLIALILGLLYGASIPLVKPMLGLQAYGPALALAPLLVLTFFMPVAYGVLQGMERFVALGLLMLVVAASRIVIGVPWTLAGGGAGGPLLGQAAGSLLALIVTAWLMREHMLRRGTGAATSGLRRRPNRRALTAGGAFVAFALVSNLDVLLAKLLLTPRAAGEYAALATIEKMVLFLPSAVSVVMVPKAAKARYAEGSAARVLRRAALLVVVTTILLAVPVAVAPHTALQTMFGSKYEHAASGVVPIVCAGAGLALLYLLVVYTVAIQDRRWVWLLAAGVVLQVSAIAALHSSPAQIATAQASVVFFVLLANELAFHPVLRAGRVLVVSARRREGWENT